MESRKYHEKEIKIKILDYEDIINRLSKIGAKHVGNAFQRTIRFDNSELGLEKKGLFLRLRTGFEDTITMKIKVKNENVFEREEIELRVNSIEKMREILNKVGLVKEFVMEKYRSLWTLKGVDVCVDELPFGFFVEIEGEEDKIFEVAKLLELDVSKKIITNYWDLFDDYKKRTGRTGTDILFDKNHKPRTRIKREFL
ncbi:MAG: class IV adenylate cyclase [Nanoarchaeota archaeon]|nr:class IV adenylate cyclase [Nanoarchaeota archaeon]